MSLETLKNKVSQKKNKGSTGNMHNLYKLKIAVFANIFLICVHTL